MLSLLSFSFKMLAVLLPLASSDPQFSPSPFTIYCRGRTYTMANEFSSESVFLLFLFFVFRSCLRYLLQSFAHLYIPDGRDQCIALRFVATRRVGDTEAAMTSLAPTSCSNLFREAVTDVGSVCNHSLLPLLSSIVRLTCTMDPGEAERGQSMPNSKCYLQATS